jgi:hypothetical protein
MLLYESFLVKTAILTYAKLPTLHHCEHFKISRYCMILYGVSSYEPPSCLLPVYDWGLVSLFCTQPTVTFAISHSSADGASLHAG